MLIKIKRHFPYKGSVLIFSLIVLAFMLVSALSIATVSVTEKRASLSTEKSTRSFQVADSGVEIMLQRIHKGNGGTPYATLDDLAASLGTTCNAQGEIGAALYSGSYNISFYDSSNTKLADCVDTAWRSRVVKIKSVGVSGNTTRAVVAEVMPPVVGCTYACVPADWPDTNNDVGNCPNTVVGNMCIPAQPIHGTPTEYCLDGPPFPATETCP